MSQDTATALAQLEQVIASLTLQVPQAISLVKALNVLQATLNEPTPSDKPAS